MMIPKQPAYSEWIHCEFIYSSFMNYNRIIFKSQCPLNLFRYEFIYINSIRTFIDLNIDSNIVWVRLSLATLLFFYFIKCIKNVLFRFLTILKNFKNNKICHQNYLKSHNIFLRIFIIYSFIFFWIVTFYSASLISPKNKLLENCQH